MLDPALRHPQNPQMSVAWYIAEAVFAVIATTLHFVRPNIDFQGGIMMLLWPLSPTHIALSFSVVYTIYIDRLTYPTLSRVTSGERESVRDIELALWRELPGLTNILTSPNGMLKMDSILLARVPSAITLKRHLGPAMGLFSKTIVL